MENVDPVLDFILRNGDKRWYLQELVITVNQALYEFASFISMDPDAELSMSKSSLHVERLRVGDLKPSPAFQILHKKFLEEENKELCENVLNIVKERPRYPNMMKALSTRMANQLNSMEQVSHTCALYNKSGLSSVKEKTLHARNLQNQISSLKETESLYMKECLKGEDYLTNFQKLTVETLEHLDDTLPLDNNSGKLMQNELYKVKKGINTFIEQLVRFQSALDEKNQLSQNKRMKYDKIKETYLFEAKTAGFNVFLYDPNWPAFQDEIKKCDFTQIHPTTQMYNSFNCLVSAIERYFMDAADVHSEFFVMLERIQSIDERMKENLKKFENSQSHCDHALISALLENYKEIKALLRKLTVKCFGNGSNAAEMRNLTEEKMRHREVLFAHIEDMKTDLEKWKDDFSTREFWEKISLKVYDYMNRVFIKGSNYESDLLKMYNYSLSYTMDKLTKISDKLSDSLHILNKSNLDTENLQFHDKVFEMKGIAVDWFERIKIDNAAVYRMRRLPNQKVQFDFRRPNAKNAISSITLELPELEVSASPATKMNGQNPAKNPPYFTDFPTNIKSIKANPDIISSLKQYSNFGMPPGTNGFTYQLVASDIIPGKTVQDYLNTIVARRSITIDGKKFTCFKHYMMTMEKDTSIQDQDYSPAFPAFANTGYGISSSSLRFKRPMNIPLVNKDALMEQELRGFLLCPTHFIQAARTKSKDIPSGDGFTMWVIIDVKEEAGQLNIRLSNCPHWTTDPFLKSMITSSATGKAKEGLNNLVGYIKKTLMQNPALIAVGGGAANVDQSSQLPPFHTEILDKRRERRELFDRYQQQKENIVKIRQTPEYVLSAGKAMFNIRGDDSGVVGNLKKGSLLITHSFRWRCQRD